MDGVGTPIIGRPRPLPGHDTPDTAHNTYTLNYEEPVYRPRPGVPARDWARRPLLVVGALNQFDGNFHLV